MEKIPSEYTGVKGLVRSMYDGLAESAADSNNEYIKPFPGGYEYIKTVELCNGKTQTVSGSSSAINPLDIASGRVRAYLSIGDTVAINGLYGIISLGIPPDGNVGNNPYIYMNSGGIFGYYGDEEAPWFMVTQRDVSIGGTDYHGGDFFIGNKDYAYLWWEHDEARLTIAGNILISGDIVSANFEYDPGLGILNGYKLEYEGGNAYFGGAVISGSSSVGGRLATTIGSAINSSGNFINDLINSNLSTASKQILGDFTFGSSGAIKMITDNNNGLWLSPNGILGKKAGVTTFAIGIDGSPTFTGEITSSIITGGTIQTSSTGDRIIMNGSTNSLEFNNSNSLYASLEPYTLYQAGSPIGYGINIETGGLYATTPAQLNIYEGISGDTHSSITSDFIDLNGTTFSMDIIPLTGNSYNLGSTSYRYNNTYTNSIGLYGSSSGVVTFKPSANAGTWTLTLPTSAGSNGQVLTTNGSGTTSWATPSSFSGNWSDIYINTNKDMQGYNLTGLTKVVPHSSNTSFLGDPSYYWDWFYVSGIYGAGGTGDITIYNNLNLYNNDIKNCYNLDVNGAIDCEGSADFNSYCSIHGVLYMNYQNIRDVADPVNNQDAANKQWVEANFVAK